MRLRKLTDTFLAPAVLAMMFIACGDKDEAPNGAMPLSGCDTLQTITYSNSIEAITATNCAISGCHAGANPTAGLNLETYAGAQSVAESGDLYERVVDWEQMPPSGPLSDCDQALIAKWINDGALEL